MYSAIEKEASRRYRKRHSPEELARRKKRRDEAMSIFNRGAVYPSLPDAPLGAKKKYMAVKTARPQMAVKTGRKMPARRRGRPRLSPEEKKQRRRKYQRAYYKKNRTKILARQKRWRDARKKKRRAVAPTAPRAIKSGMFLAKNAPVIKPEPM